MVSQLQMVSTVDLYYICQLVGGVTRTPGAFLRKRLIPFDPAAQDVVLRGLPI
jgi:hypothetical protein